MTNPNLNTYELTPEDNARFDVEIENIRNDKDNPYCDNEPFLAQLRTLRARAFVEENTTLNLTIPLRLAEYLFNIARGMEPDVGSDFKNLIQEQTGVELP